MNCLHRRLFYVLLALFSGVALPQGVQSALAEPVAIPSSERLTDLAPRLSSQVAKLATTAVRCAEGQSAEIRPEKLAIIDYSLPSTDKRFWLFDLRQKRLLLEDRVAHGKNTGENRAQRFSNLPGSLQSSIGLFQVGGSYVGKHGNSLRLIGLERGVNDLALDRAIVIHGADYVSDGFIRIHKRLGRSFGCPAMAPETAEKVIESFEDSPGLLFSYYPDEQWLRSSKFLNSCTPA